MRRNTAWYVYILKCGDNSLYTGVTNDLARRISAHNQGKGAKYTRSHLPVSLVYSESHLDRSRALKREAELKKYSHHQKLTLIQK